MNSYILGICNRYLFRHEAEQNKDASDGVSKSFFKAPTERPRMKTLVLFPLCSVFAPPSDFSAS